MVKAICAVIVLLTVVRVSLADGPDYTFPRADRHILPIAPGKSQVKACRSTPKGITAVWEPTEDDIDMLEAHLSAFLSRQLMMPRRSYGRQYIGIVISGKRLIYGNFYPPSSDPRAKEIESTRPVVSCDGGSQFWGIVFDPRSKTFSDLQFNGDI
jgi:hypothetical protein